MDLWTKLNPCSKVQSTEPNLFSNCRGLQSFHLKILQGIPSSWSSTSAYIFILFFFFLAYARSIRQTCFTTAFISVRWPALQTSQQAQKPGFTVAEPLAERGSVRMSIRIRVLEWVMRRLRPQPVVAAALECVCTNYELLKMVQVEW